MQSYIIYGENKRLTKHEAFQRLTNHEMKNFRRMTNGEASTYLNKITEEQKYRSPIVIDLRKL
ncbi:MAG: hypothetical protein K0R54_178 [Clostridiaceae bacterium]|jgi:hypothetical protein|nr:hypothetical protein [Clostridiaceae bacterium]